MIETHAITTSTYNRAITEWETAASSDVSWLFANGQLVYGPLYDDDTARDVEFSLTDGYQVAAEIQTFDDDTVTPASINVLPNSKPILKWHHVDDAEKYNVYHKETLTGDEALILTVPAWDTDFYEVDCPTRLNGAGGVWSWFRVESVDEYGNESTTTSWRFWVYDMPDPLDSISIANGSGSGLFNITITE